MTRTARLLLRVFRDTRRLRFDLAETARRVRALEEENRGLQATLAAMRPWWLKC